MDTGVLSLRPSACAPVREHFLAQDEYVGLDGLQGFYEWKFLRGRGWTASSWRLAAPGRAASAIKICTFWLSTRLPRAVRWARWRAICAPGRSGGRWRNWEKRFPAACEGNPYLYVLAKDTPDGLALGLWNLFEDPACGRVRLNRAYQRVEACGAQARLVEGGTALELETEIPPWSFALFALAQ